MQHDDANDRQSRGMSRRDFVSLAAVAAAGAGDAHGR